MKAIVFYDESQYMAEPYEAAMASLAANPAIDVAHATSDIEAFADALDTGEYHVFIAIGEDSELLADLEASKPPVPVLMIAYPNGDGSVHYSARYYKNDFGRGLFTRDSRAVKDWIVESGKDLLNYLQSLAEAWAIKTLETQLEIAKSLPDGQYKLTIKLGWNQHGPVAEVALEVVATQDAIVEALENGIARLKKP